MVHHKRSITTFSCVAFFLMILSPLGVTAGQEQERVVSKTWLKPAPLKIKVIKTRKGEFQPEQKIVDGEDWFRGLSIVLKNVSSKTITYIGVGFLFPRDSEEVGKPAPLLHTLLYGHHPKAPQELLLTVPPLALKPGESFTIALSDADYSDITNNLRKLGYNRGIKGIKFHLQEIYFDDSTGWSTGHWILNTEDMPERQPLGEMPASSNPYRFLSHGLREYKSRRLLKLSEDQLA